MHACTARVVFKFVFGILGEGLVLGKSFQRLDRRMSEASVWGLELVGRRGGKEVKREKE
jgi:hypothetical protein